MRVRKTNEQFTKEVYELVGDEYTFLEPYIHSQTKIEVVHNHCEHRYEVTPANFLNIGNRCPECNRDKNKWTNEMFVERVKEEVGDEYTFLKPYVNTRTKLEVVHNKCGYRYGVTPANFIHIGSRCQYCYTPSNKWTNEMFVERVKEEVGDEYTFLKPYVRSQTKLAVVHNTCGHRYEVTPAAFLNQGSRCPACKTIRAKTNEQFTKEVYELVGDEYTFLETYVNSKTKLAVVHNTCGHRYEVTPSSFLNVGSRCPSCSHKMKDVMFVAKVKEEVGDEYTFLSSYKYNNKHLPVIHNTCGHRYEVTPAAFLNQGSRCPACNESKGERKIADYLNKLGILFEREKTFSDLKVINSLRYDFAIYHKGELITLIEYDGEQHFIAVDYFGGEEQLLKTQLHDKIKNEYAKENNISLLRIPYNDYDNIEEILDKYLSDHFRTIVYIDIY